MLENLPTLTPYQIAWLKVPSYRPVTFKRKDGSYFKKTQGTVKCLTKSRRIGGSFACQLESVLSGAGINYATSTDVAPMDTFVVSATERQAKEFIKECGELAELFAESDIRFKPKIQSTLITFVHTKKRIISLPASGRAIRGATGRVVLDEVCFMPKFDEIWGAASPIARGNMKNPEGYPISVLSTPWAKGTQAHRTLTRGHPFYCFQVDLRTAIEQGFKGVASLKSVKDEVGNDEIFRVEYMCEWLDTGNAYFPVSIIERAILPSEPGFSADGASIEKLYPDNPVIWGVDIGRTHDLTVAAKFIQEKDCMYLVDIFKMRNVPMHEQADRLIEQIGDNPTLIRVDRGTQGYSVYDAFVAKYGREIVHSAELNQESQVKHMMNLKHMMEKQTLKIANHFSVEPASTLKIELLKIEQKATQGGRVVMHTPRDMHGHCDRAWAVAIGVGKYIRDIGTDDLGHKIGAHASAIDEKSQITIAQDLMNLGIITPYDLVEDWLLLLPLN